MATIANFNFNCDLSPVIWWKYQEAPLFKQLILNQQSFLKEAVGDFAQFLKTDILNIQTASKEGLAIWGRLLGVGRPIYTNSEGNQITFTDDQYRLLLRARTYLLTFDGSARALNEFFKILFPDIVVQIIDNYNMTATIHFIGELTDEQKVLFQYPFINTFLPRPSGVQYNIGDTGTADLSQTFGFEGMDGVNGFDNGTFYE